MSLPTPEGASTQKEATVDEPEDEFDDEALLAALVASCDAADGALDAGDGGDGGGNGGGGASSSVASEDPYLDYWGLLDPV